MCSLCGIGYDNPVMIHDFLMVSSGEIPGSQHLELLRICTLQLAHFFAGAKPMYISVGEMFAWLNPLTMYIYIYIIYYIHDTWDDAPCCTWDAHFYQGNHAKVGHSISGKNLAVFGPSDAAGHSYFRADIIVWVNFITTS